MKRRKAQLGVGGGVAAIAATFAALSLAAMPAAADGWYDEDGNGVGDQYHVDSSGDGVTDVIGADIDENGYFEGFIADFDRNGTFETTASDSSGNGVVDIIAVDTDGDMVWDTVFSDVDENGMLDQLQGPAVTPQLNAQVLNDIMVTHIVTMQQLQIYYDTM